MSATPPSGGRHTIVTLRGSHFATVPAENEVWFGGTQAEVLEASTDQLVVRASELVVESTQTVPVTVLVQHQTSNTLPWIALTAGSLAPDAPRTLIEPVGVAVVGDLVYVADARAGLFVLDPVSTVLKPLPLAGVPIGRPVEMVARLSAHELYLIAATPSDEHLIARVDLTANRYEVVAAFGEQKVANLAVSDAGVVYAVRRGDGAVLVLDTATLQPRVLEEGPTSITGLATVGERLFAVSGVLVHEWDLTSEGFVQVPGLPQILGIANGGDRLLLRDTSRFQVYDPESRTVTDTEILIPVRTDESFGRLEDGSFVSFHGGVVRSSIDSTELLSAAAYPVSFVPSEDGAIIWPARGTYGPGGLFRTDADGTRRVAQLASTFEVIEPIPGGYLLVSNYGGTVVRFDEASGTSTPLYSNFHYLADVMVEGDRVYLLEREFDVSAIHVGDLGGGALTRNWFTGGDFTTALSRGGELIIAGNGGLFRVETGRGMPPTAQALVGIGEWTSDISVDTDGALLIAAEFRAWRWDGHSRPVLLEPSVEEDLHSTWAIKATSGGDYILSTDSGFRRLVR